VAAEASDGHEVMQKLSKTPVDIVLLDLSMPGSNGIEILKQIRIKFPKRRVLVLSQHPEDQYAIRAFRAGASGYLTKERASSDLIAAIRKVASGGKCISEAVAEQLASSLDKDSGKPPHELLSDREYEILCLLGTGKTVSEIGEDLCLSVKTISTYRTRILEKMNMTKTTELMLYAMQHRLLSPEPLPAGRQALPQA
jgi:two-component system invasion response regulator UvrY